jgi:primosomal protein N''
VINDKNFEIELLQKDVNNNELQLMKFKDKVVEQSKLQEKLKLIEQKYVQDINLAKNKINKDEDEKNKEGKKNVKLMSIN